jgi:uncharacterized membrane protein
MDSNTIGAGGIEMTSLNQRVSVNRAIHPTGMLIVVAILLIVVGLAFEAIQIGWAHLLPHGLWLFSVIVPGLWNMLAVQWNDPVWRQLLKIAPLALVALGMMILFVQKRAHTQQRPTGSPNGDNHDA